MVKFKVTVDAGKTYKGEYTGVSLETTELKGSNSIIVNNEDGSYTLHRLDNVESIELVE